MNYNWKNYLSENEIIKVDFGVSNLYAGATLIFLTILSILLSLSNIFAGLGIFLLSFLYWVYLTRGKRYALTNKKLIIIDSFLGKNVTSINFENITDITVDQNTIDIIGGWGNVIINTAGTNSFEAVLQNIHNPQMLKNKIDDLTHPSDKI